MNRKEKRAEFRKMKKEAPKLKKEILSQVDKDRDKLLTHAFVLAFNRVTKCKYEVIKETLKKAEIIQEEMLIDMKGLDKLRLLVESEVNFKVEADCKLENTNTFGCNKEIFKDNLLKYVEKIRVDALMLSWVLALSRLYGYDKNICIKILEMTDDIMGDFNKGYITYLEMQSMIKKEVGIWLNL